MGTNTAGGKMALADWRDVALNSRRVIIAFDGDVARKDRGAEGVPAPWPTTWRTWAPGSSTCTCPTPLTRPAWTTT